MPAMVRMFETHDDGSFTESMMFPVDAAHAVMVSPGQWSYEKPAPKAKALAPVDLDQAATVADDEPIAELPALPRGPGRPRKDGGAA